MIIRTDRKTRTPSLRRGNAGFTILETVVSIGMFTVLTLIIMGAFLSIMEASRKARSTRIALDNVSGALDYMAREIRLGLYLRCEDDAFIAPEDLMTVASCPYPTGGNILALERSGKDLGNTADQLVFKYEAAQIFRSVDGGATWESLTPPELDVTDFRFYVDGTDHAGISPGDADQPRVTIFIRGVAGGGRVKTQVNFSLQTTLSVRGPNIPPP